jgi:hypothetical protein
MSKDSVIELKKPEALNDDPISEIVRNGARRLLAQALETEIEVFMSQYTELKNEPGRQRIVRNGYLPERQILRGIGSNPIKATRVRDRHSDPSKRARYKLRSCRRNIESNTGKQRNQVRQNG